MSDFFVMLNPTQRPEMISKIRLNYITIEIIEHALSVENKTTFTAKTLFLSFHTQIQ